MSNCFQLFSINNLHPEKDDAIILYFNKLNFAVKADVETFYDTLGGVLAVVESKASNSYLICFLINQRNFLAAQFPFLIKENDLEFLEKNL